MNNKNIQLIVLLLLIISIPLTVLAVQLAFDLQTTADPGSNPQEIIVSNLTESSATICWYTSEARTGIINYGTTEGDLTLIANDSRDTAGSAGEYNNHCIRIRNLLPETQYFYQITSGSETFTTDGTNTLEFTTLPSSDDLATPDSLIGSISPIVTEGVVYAHASDGTNTSTPISVLVSSSNYAISKSNFRDPTTGDIYDISNSDILISFTDSEGRRGNTQISGSTEQADTITISAAGTEYNPNLVFQPQVANSTTTPAPTSVSTPVPTTVTTVGEVNTTNLITTTVSYGDENTDPTIPYNMFISNISPTTFCVNWLTKQPTVGRLLYKREGDVDKIAIDGRDSISTQSKKYTHRVCFSEPDFTEGEKVGFFIVADTERYGLNLGSNEADRFVFAMPPTTSSPPSPGSVQGTIDKTYEPISNSPEDVLLYARYEGSTNSTWVSTYPDSSGSNWNLEYDSILDQNLSTYYSDDTSIYQLNVRGEFNSQASDQITDPSDIVSLVIDPGVAITNIEQNEQINSEELLTGTANPNSNVTVTIGGQEYTTESNTYGEWSVNATALSAGNQQINSIDSNGQSISLSVEVSGALPATAIEDLRPVFYGIILIIIGIILKRTIDSRSIEKF